MAQDMKGFPWAQLRAMCLALNLIYQDWNGFLRLFLVLQGRLILVAILELLVLVYIILNQAFNYDSKR